MKFVRRIFRFFLKVFLWFFAISIGLVILYRFVPVPITPLMVIRLFEQAADEDRKMKLKKDWVPMEEISKNAPQAVYASEDQKFLEHSGFDFEAMKKAWEGNQQGKNIKGASTITQQTVKNVFLWHGRNYLRKGLEAYFTVLVELIWSKERIMEVYLNVIEMGDGIYGIEAASQEFYKKPAANLSRAEAAMIAAVLPNPIRWSPTRPTNYNRQRQAWIMKQMNNLNPLGWGN
ncbi:monofunctional biosynthetic peptidoglycan transglycosylase [Algoriphagus zhangzhouensis]|uniref:Biosynthetic peptidoglycan transglycosylase n=1 Tax=Algoriphagus zhangzhouensis TaxID=1073327 RepID=A0A1M7ZA59_9BACT|nr:monofunctional biosynthetic peptidoglycan transglycosylase [Algoriphagus zhangzhouensis]TDY47241.1 monofunctional biosynthetic peptidoglycan transglycosylase [Algoriphagus zhangzhouensis]SHO61781.1 monofunctional biosynthetic peptidoglycan transglycosylase [Algoriphagus zhangzhouensis]